MNGHGNEASLNRSRTSEVILVRGASNEIPSWRGPGLLITIPNYCNSIAIRGNRYDTSICDLRVRLSFLAFGADSKAKIVAMLANLAASKSCSSLQTFCTSVEQYCATMMPGANI